MDPSSDAPYLDRQTNGIGTGDMVQNG